MDLDPRLLALLSPEEVVDLVESLPDTSVAPVLASLRSTTTSLLQVAETVLPSYHQRDHTDYLADALTDAVARAERGESARLVVEMPPGQGKSSICSVALPLYALSRNPHWEVVLVSAEASLAAKWSRDSRRVVAEGLIPGVSLSADSQAQTEWETTAGGSMIARGVGGQITGRRAHLMVIDDPIKNLAEAHSETQRELLWQTWQSVLKTRLRPGSVVVLVQTRWHEDDLAGRLLASGAEWTEVRFPAIAEEADALGRAPGDPLLSPQTEETPERALARWAETRAEVGSYIWDALYQQRPSPPGGTTFNAAWWQFYDTPPPPDEGVLITSWDLTYGASGPDSGDFVVGQVWQRVGADCYLINQVRGRWPFTEQLRQIASLAERYPQAHTHLVENAANGAAAIDTLRRQFPGVLPVSPKGSKEVRAMAVAPMVESGNVYLPRHAHWLNDFLAETTSFPTGAHDDQVDAMTQALKRLAENGKATMSVADYSPSVGVASTPSLAAVLRGGF